MFATYKPVKILSSIESNVLLHDSERLYSVVDACQAPELIELARSKFMQPNRMLFKGTSASLKEIETVAPFFIPIDPHSDFLDHWSKCWGNNTGILIVSSVEARMVFRHLRKIFVVQDEQQQEYFFRFYDPRVLRLFLPTCSAEELVMFFGPISRILLENQKVNTWEGYTLGKEGL